MGISNKVIKQNLKEENWFIDVFTADLIPKTMRKLDNGVINLDVSIGSVTHWVC